NIEKDNQSEEIWKNIFENAGLNPKERISIYGADKNWWSRSGLPEQMPEGEPGGPDSEVFFDFETPHDEKFGKMCHPNCQCGRFLEIGNSVFMQYKKTERGFEELPQKNVDFGGGLERLLAAVENQQDMFQTSLFKPIINNIEKITKSDYESNKRAIRIIADHLIAAVFIATSDISPSNKEQGYVLRRFLRRSIRYGRQLGIRKAFTAEIASFIIDNYSNTDPLLINKRGIIKKLFTDEEEKFDRVIKEGLKKSEKIFSIRTSIEPYEYSKIMQISDKKEFFRNFYRIKKKEEQSKLLSRLGISLAPEAIRRATITGEEAFDLYQSFGFPIEMMIELVQEQGLFVDIEAFQEKMKQHQNISRKGAEKKFHGGLADHQEQTIKGHTATHLLHQALRDVLGNHVYQTGSNITTERIRFDFNYDKPLTNEEIKKVENIVNEKIKENLPVHFEIIPIEKAKKIGAIGLFNEKYQDKVRVYFIGDYSKEFCGGPHIDFTGGLKRFKIIKQENIGHGQRRIYSKIND
ncbi:MAG: alanine--tRNA ligase-related protein, partial [bacterium]|nr:alanine--tRNA ligase-related protein [bacterium]